MCSRHWKVIVIPLVTLLTGGTAIGAAPTKEEIAKAIQRLGDDKFDVREKASAFLWKAGRAAESALQEALKSDDREVVRRAQEILEKFKWGIYPDTPKNIVALIDEYRFGDDNGKQAVVQKLLQMGGKGHMVLLKLAGAEENANLRRTLFQQIAQQASQKAVGLIVEGDLSSIDEFLELGMAGGDETAVRNYVAFLVLRGRIDEKVPHWKTQANQRGNQQAAAVLAHLHKAKGDLASARLVAEKSGKPSLLNAILYEQGDWAALLKKAQAQPSLKGDNIEEIGYLATYQRLAGKTADFQKTIDEIQKFGNTRPNQTTDSGRWYSAEALLLNDRPQDAIGLLTNGKNYLAAFDLLAAQGRYREAFALADKAAESKQQPAIRLRRARLLHMLGERDQARQIFAKVAEEIKDAKDLAALGSLIEMEYRLGLKDQAFEHAARLLARGTEEEPQTWVLGQVFPKKSAVAGFCWRFFRKKFPDDDAASNLKRVRDLLEGQLTGKPFADLLQDVEKEAAGLGKVELRESWLLALAEIAVIASDRDRAQTYFEKAADLPGSATALLRFGDFLAEQKFWKQAADRYYQAWLKDKNQALPLFLHGSAMAKAGQAKEGQKYMDQARLLPLGSEEARHSFAQALSERGLADAARREFDLIIRLGGEETWYVGDALRHAAQHALTKKDYLKAAASYERAMLRCLQMNTAFLETAAYLVVPHMVHRYRAQGLLAAGKLDEARKEAELCLAALPGHVELPILLVPELEKRGRQQEADGLFKRVFGPLEKQCAEYPKSPWSHNSLAWLAACCHRQLDKGLQHSQKAVELAPNHAGYIDTLAEVHFQRGQREKAIQLMKKCVELEPKNRYFREQLKRFEAGDPKAPLPETPENE